MSSKFKVQSSKLVDGARWSAVCRAVLFAVLLILTAAYRPLTTVSAHEGEDHSKDAKTTAATPAANAESVSIVTAELGKTAGLIGGASAALDEIFARDRLMSWIDEGTPRSSIGRAAWPASVGRTSPEVREDRRSPDAAGRTSRMPAGASPAGHVP